MKKIAFQSRDNRGAAMTSLVVVLFMILTMLAFFVYDMNRMQMAQRQLTAVCDAAAMAGSSMLSSQDVSYEDANEDQLFRAQSSASQYAQNMFCTGTILGSRLTAGGGGAQTIPVTLATSAAALANVQANNVSIFIQLADPGNGFAPFQLGNAQGRAFVVQAAYGYKPTLSVLGIGGTLIVPAQSTAATQMMNVVVVFDCSGSMDDSTAVTFVERIWDQASGQYNYITVHNSGADNTLCNYTGLNFALAPNGVPLNVLPPQNLTDLGYLYNGVYSQWGSSATAGVYAANPPLAFDWSMRAYVATPKTSYPWSNGGLATNYSVLTFPGPLYDNDFGTPPGNCDLKYGSKQTFGLPTNLWAAAGVTCWDGVAAHGWGPGVSPGYYNGPGGPNGLANKTNDGNRYFYDPFAIPSPYNGNAFAPFTDMVVNLVDLNWAAGSGTNPCTNQPLTASGPFGGFVQAFPNSTFNVFFAEGSGASAAYNYESDPELQGKNFNFGNLAYLVEAARGNLDTVRNYTNALLSVGSDQGYVIAVGDVRVGYQKAYQRLAMYVSQPFATAQSGAFKFFQNLAQTSAAYFGFVGFSASPAKYNGNPDTCAYLTNGGFPTSLFYSCTGTPSAAAPTYADFFYHASVGTATTPNINPNVWMWSPMAVTGPANNPPAVAAGAAAATPTGIPYSINAVSANPSGPDVNASAVSMSFGAHVGKAAAGNPTNVKVNWAFCNVGFQIPRCFLYAGGNGGTDTANGVVQQQTFNGVCSNETMSIWNPNSTLPTGGDVNAANAGSNGLFHCRPLTDTDSLEALETGLANLGVSVAGGGGVNAFSFAALTGYGQALNNTRPGAINVLCFFTDGTPTDTLPPAAGNGGMADFSNYTNQVINPAQKNGIPIYSIGLALNPNVQADQFQFLNTLTNNGANGSQFFQVTNAASLTGAFTGIAKQLTQCLR